MVKRNNHNNPQAAEFTDYTVAGTDEGRYNAARLREKCEQADDYIHTTRSLRRIVKKTANPCRTEGDDVRCGYPTKRERNEDMPSKRGVPHSNFLKRFKIVERLVGTGFGDLVWVAKIYVLHATRGWKLYA